MRSIADVAVEVMAAASCFLIAGPETGAGKTTVSAGLLAALRRRGLRVQPFKVGPDYIDPGFLTRAAGRLARNLDGWLLPAPTVRWLFHRHAASADVALVEGMMGLFDGYSGLDDQGSSAHIARMLGLPVLVVLDAARAVRSVAAVARGCQVLDRRIEIAGWILNRVAGETHLRWVREAVEEATGRPVLGHLPEDPRLRLPERHLGLVQAHEPEGGGSLSRVLPHLVREIERRFDLDRILRLGHRRKALKAVGSPVERFVERQGAGRGAPPRGHRSRGPARPVIAWADDEAFTFQYADNIELLELLGARVARWSPLHDRRLPDGAGALVLGGGYPELLADELADNEAMLDAVRSFAAAGGAIYAECGGFMYLTRGIIAAPQSDPGGRTMACPLSGGPAGRRRAHLADRPPARLAGLVPAWTRMTGRTRVAYVEVETARDTLLAPRGARVRGHEFHASALDRPLPAAAAAFRVLAPSRRLEGFARDGLLASYVHLNFLSRPPLAARLVAAAAMRR